MKIYLIFFLFLTNYLFAEIQSTIKNRFEVVVNDSLIELSQSWYDSLKVESNQRNICYQIAGYETSKQATTAKLKIPQTLKLKEIIRQVVIYFRMLKNENEKEKEKLLLYPFFSDITEPEFIKCTYSDQTYYFNVKKWETVPVPSQPTPEEKFIYNQVLKSTLQKTLVFGELPEDVFKEVSLNHNKPIDKVHKIYERAWNTCL